MKKGTVKKQSTSRSKINQYIPPIELKKIPPEKALAILKKAGYDIDQNQSEEIMDFLYVIVKLTLKEYFTSD